MASLPRQGLWLSGASLAYESSSEDLLRLQSPLSRVEPDLASPLDVDYSFVSLVAVFAYLTRRECQVPGHPYPWAS